MQHALKLSVVFFALMILAFTIPGCEPQPVHDANETIDQVRGDLTGAAGDLTAASTNIKGNTERVRKAVPASSRPAVDPPLADIDKQADGVNATAAKLATMESALQSARKDVEDERAAAAARIAAAEKQRDEAIAARKDAILNLIAVIAGFAILGGIACGVGAFFTQGNKFLITGSVVCFIVAGAAIALHEYFKIVTIVCGCMLAAVVVAGVIWLIRKYRDTQIEVADKTTAAVDLTQAFEIIKAGLTDLGQQGVEFRKKMFGDGVNFGAIFHNNSETTDTIVKDIRASGEVKLAPPLAR